MKLSNSSHSDDVFDYVIVGAGAAGSVLANRLSEDPSNRVLLLEFGGPDWNPVIWIPKGFFFLLQWKRYRYQYPTQPVAPSGRVQVWTRGKVLGGSTVVNGMMWNRGGPTDWEAVAAPGNPAFSWEHVLSAYRAIENHSLGASDMRGAGGPLGVSVVEEDDEILHAILAAAQGMGWERVADTNASDGERIGFVPAMITDGVRNTAYSAFVRPVSGRPNLTVLTRIRANQLLFDGGRVAGVSASNGTGRVDYGARKEVIVSAGTIETPLLLERSGIGRPEVLRNAGVDLRVESPNVGERIIEQSHITMQFRLKGNVGETERLNTLPKQAWEGFKYLFTRSGPVAEPGFNLVSGFKSSPSLDRPDIQGQFVPLAVDPSSPTFKLADHSGVQFVGFPISPTTKSSIHLGGRLPGNAPIIDARYLEDEGDCKATAPVLGIARELFATSPLADYVVEEEVPGPAVSSDDGLQYARNAESASYHAVGACAMGPNSDDVVDPELRVRGVDGLRVVDASVLPAQVSGNTAAPVMAVAWIAAELILEDS